MSARHHVPELAPPIPYEHLTGGALLAFHIIPLLRSAYFSEKDKEKQDWIRCSYNLALDDLENRTGWHLDALALP